MEWNRGRTIGRGSSATVSLAMSRLSGKIFAVKSSELSRSEFLQREQRLLSLINCPHIVEYLGCDITNENGHLMYNLFMEYASGGTLTDSIHDNGGRLSESAIRSHTRAILQGLDYLHSHGLVHCDIKGRNVLVGSNGTKIADLGCARLVWEPAVPPISGTPVFMAPEVARGDEQSFPADIWALGCTVIEMATGRPPWPEAVDPVSALYRIAFSSDTPEFPSFMSEKAKDFLGKCLNRNSKERWTADQLLKHSFLDDDDDDDCSVVLNLKKIEGSIFSNSPTGILDQGFWDSLEKSETERLVLGTSNSPANRIQRLTGGNPSSVPISRVPDWTWDGDWVTVRSSNNHAGHDLGQTMMRTDEPAGTSGRDEVEMELLGRSSSVINGDEHQIHYTINSSSSSISSSERSFSVACKGVGAKQFLVSSILIPL